MDVPKDVCSVLTVYFMQGGCVHALILVDFNVKLSLRST
jgi:hypothetical protein